MPEPKHSTLRRDELPIAGRLMELRGFTRADEGGGGASPLATAEIVFTTGAPVRRYDFWRERAYHEVLVVEDGAMRLERLQRGAPLLNSHSSWDLEDQLGVVEQPVIEGGRGTCRATFSRRESCAGFVQDVADGIIRNVSVGYVRHRVEMVPPEQDGGVWTYRVIDWEPYEVSLVPIPADMDSQVLRAAGDATPADPAAHLRTFPCEFIETRAAGSARSPAVGVSADLLNQRTPAMTPEEIAAAAQTQRAATEAAAAEAARAQAVEAAQATERARSAGITEICQRHNVASLAAGLIHAGSTVEAARGAVLDELARRDAAGGGHRNLGRIETVRDEMQTRIAGIEQAILHRIAPATELDDNGRQYRGLSLLEIGRDFLEAHGVNTRGTDRMTLASRILSFRAGGMMGTSDFAGLFANVANKRLRGAYDENPGTYGIWARRAPNAPDFKSMNVVQLSGAPDLLQVNEHGEFKVGAMKDGAETYAVLTYGRIVPLTRQAIINDDLRAFDRLVTAFGFAARRLENRTVYSQLTANANMADGVALFHATHGNLETGAPSALQFSALATARKNMRLQKGLQSEELNLAPSYLIVPAALEQTAYQLTSSQYTPATKAEVNEFRAGGRTALTPVVEPVLDANSATAWYLASDSSQVDTVEYCYLDGAEGPVIESEVGFDTDGVSYKCRLDFAAKAVDHRGLHKANGA